MTDETEELHRDWDSVKTSKKLLTPDLYFVRPKTGKEEKKVHPFPMVLEKDAGPAPV
jgi:hypothetical protein